METLRKIKMASATLLLATVVFVGCKKDNLSDENATGGTTTTYGKTISTNISPTAATAKIISPTPIFREGAISVAMTNLSTAPYGKVDVEIVGVTAHYLSKSGNDGFITLPVKAGIYDLLEIENYLSASLVNAAMIPV